MSIHTLAAKSVKAQRELMASAKYAQMTRDERVKALKEIILRFRPSASLANAVESLREV